MADIQTQLGEVPPRKSIILTRDEAETILIERANMRTIARAVETIHKMIQGMRAKL